MKPVLAACLSISALLPIAALAEAPAVDNAAAATPAVKTPPTPVSVVNRLTNPVHVSDVAKPVHEPFSKRFDISFSGGSGNAILTVPEGKLLVVTYVSSDVGVPSGGTVLFDLATTYAGGEVESHFPEISQGLILGQQVMASSERTTIYADPGSTVTAAFLSSSSTGGGGAIVGIYGYLVDATAASFE